MESNGTEFTDEQLDAAVQPPTDDAAPASAPEPEAAPASGAKEPPLQLDQSQRVDGGRPQHIPGYVPHGAMHQEREGRIAAERKTAELEARLAALENPETPEEEPPIVDGLIDPEGFQKRQAWERNQQDKAVKAAQDRMDALEQQTRDREYLAQVTAFVREDAKAYTEANPEYTEAMQWATTNLHNHYQAQGMTEPQIAANIRALTIDNAQLADSMGVSPAALLHWRAQQQGFTPASAPAPAPAGEAAKIEAQAEAAKHASGLGSGGGAAQQGKLTLEDFAKMSDDDADKLSDKQLQEILRPN